MLVSKTLRKYRICVYYTDLNKAFLKDSYLLLNIDKLVDDLEGYWVLSFMDVYSRYNQIPFELKNDDMAYHKKQ